MANAFVGTSTVSLDALTVMTALMVPTCACGQSVSSRIHSINIHLDRARERVAARVMRELTFIEVFAGTARLCTAVRRHGLPMSFAVDKFVPKHATCIAFSAPV